MGGDGRSRLSGGSSTCVCGDVRRLIGAWLLLGRRRVCALHASVFVGLTRAQLQMVAGAGGPRRPAAAEAVVGDYAMMQGALRA